MIIEGLTMNKDLLSMSDMSRDEILDIVALGIDMKADLRGSNNKYSNIFANKILAMIFAKSSTRTRLSFETAMIRGGGSAIFLSTADIQLGRGECIYDTAKVMERFVDAIMIRTFKHSDVEELATHASIPIINALTDDEHPCQILADLMTIYEHKKTLEGLKVSYFGDGNNVAASIALACDILGLECAIASPKDYTLPKSIQERAKSVLYTENAEEAARGADVVYTDTWISMGQEDQYEQKLKHFADYSVNDELMSICKSDYIFLHCLPAYRGKEVTESIIDGSHSVIFDEAENRMHAQKALLHRLLNPVK